MRDQNKCGNCGKEAVARIKLIHPAVSNQPDPVCQGCLGQWLDWYEGLRCRGAVLQVERYAQAVRVQ